MTEPKRSEDDRLIAYGPAFSVALALLLWIYFLGVRPKYGSDHIFGVRVPWTGFSWSVGGLAFGAVGCVVIVVFMVHGVRAATEFPIGKVVVSVFAFIFSFVAYFSALYYALDRHSHGHCFGHFPHPITKLDAAYYTLGTLTTAGAGNLHAHSQTCIGFTVGQLALGIILSGLGLAVLVNRLT